MERSKHALAVKSQKWLAEALIHLIQRKSYEEITISELCIKAKLDRRTFYRNFQDKNDVLTFYFSTLQDEYLAGLKEVREHTFFTLAKFHFEFWSNRLEFLKTAQNNQAVFAMLIQMLNDFVPAIYARMNGGVSEEFQYNVVFVIGGFHNVLIRWVSAGCLETPEEIAAIVAEMFDDTLAYWPVLDP